MDVYLIPLNGGRYELYCEPAAEAGDGAPEPSAGWLERWLDRFRVMLARLDLPEAAAPVDNAPRTWRRWASAGVQRWAAEKVAEQRLLWRLRRARSVRAFHPDDLSNEAAAALVRGALTADLNRHRRWMVVHAAALTFATVVLGPLFLLVPGVANLPALYFAFRAFGHYLSSRGARHGLNGADWTYSACDALTAIRRLHDLPSADRMRAVEELAVRLGLSHLTRFYRRTADWRA